jgi:GNAT superfamily N-acetyltransferase
MSFQTRLATIDDLEILVAFTLAEAQDAEGLAAEPERTRMGVQTGLADPALARYWVIQRNEGEVVGSDWHAGYYWWIQSLYIKPAFRGQGLLSTLLDAVREVAQQEGALSLCLYVHRENERAIQAYRREGFATAPYQIMMITL